MPKIKSNNRWCRFKKDGGKCEKSSIKIGEGGACEAYEPDFAYYFWYGPNHMTTNFLTFQDIRLHPEYRYSIYYLLKCLPIVCLMDDIRGLVILCHRGTKEYLSAKDIFDLMETDMDDDALEECIHDFLTNGLPVYLLEHRKPHPTK